MKSIKRIVMIGIMTLTSISMFVASARAESPGPYQAFMSNGPSEPAGPAGTTGYRCPLYNQEGDLVGYSEGWSTDWLNPDAMGHHQLALTGENGGSLGGDIPNFAIMIIEHKIDDEALNAFPEAATYLASHPKSKCRILTLSANQDLPPGGGGTGAFSDVTHIDVRCTFLICDGQFVRCLRCMYVVS